MFIICCNLYCRYRLVSNNNYKSKKEHKYAWLTGLVNRCSFLIVSISVTACANYEYQAHPIEPENTVAVFYQRNQQDSGLKQFLEANNYSVEPWPVSSWDLHGLTLLAIYFSPSIQLAIDSISVKQAEVRIAGQRPNPTIGVPTEYRTEDRPSPWLIGLVSNFLFQREAKREALRDVSVFQQEAARLELENQAWQMYSAIHQAYVAHYAAVNSKRFLIRQNELFKQHLTLLEQRLEYGQVSEFEISRIRLQLQQNQLDISQQEYLINDTYYALTALTGLDVNQFKNKALGFDEIAHYSSFNVDNILLLKQALLFNRYDINVMLAEYQAFEAALKLEIEKQYPDINLSPGFVFEQADYIWALGASWVLPLFHNNQGQIEKALAERELKRTQFVQRQTELINELERKQQNFIDRSKAYQKNINLLESVKQRLSELQKQYSLGYVDSLALLRAELEMEKAKQALFAMKLNMIRSLLAIESITQKPINQMIDIRTMIQQLTAAVTE